MHRVPTLWKANAIAFASSFCVMVIELIAGRILAPYIGVSLYTWTSIIGVVLGGIALGNYAGGKIADRFPSPRLLFIVFLAGGLATVAVLPATKTFATAGWLGELPVMFSFTLKTGLIFFLPAFILSMVSPLLIKLTLADLGRTGGVVGTIYAFSTAGSILGTFMTGFLFILWFGTRHIVWLVAAALILIGIVSWFSWKVPGRWKPSLKNVVIWLVVVAVIATSVAVFRVPRYWQETYTKESNYYTIQVSTYADDKDIYKVLVLDHLVHSFVVPDSPTTLKYPYLKVLEEITRYTVSEGQSLRVLHLGGGGYSFPRYLEAVYPGTVNEVVEIDPAVTQIAHQELGLPADTSIKTYNQDARLFLIRRQAAQKYDIVIGDVFNDRSTPYHLTTLEFDRLVKANMAKDGLYLINIIDDYSKGRYLTSFIRTLRQVFDNVYLFRVTGERTFIIIATDRRIDLDDYRQTVSQDGQVELAGPPFDDAELNDYMVGKDPVLLTDDHAPTDIMVAPLTVRR